MVVIVSKMVAAVFATVTQSMDTKRKKARWVKFMKLLADAEEYC